VNRQVGLIRGMFKWGVTMQLIPANVLTALQTVPGLNSETVAQDGHASVPFRPRESLEATWTELRRVGQSAARAQASKTNKSEGARAIWCDARKSRTGKQLVDRKNVCAKSNQCARQLIGYGPRINQWSTLCTM
jgi:hypothetical protein